MLIETQFSNIYISTDIQAILSKILNEYRKKKLFVIVDENTKDQCLTRIESIIDYTNYTQWEITKS